MNTLPSFPNTGDELLSVPIEPDWLSEHVGVLPDDRVKIDPQRWAELVGFTERREGIGATCQVFDARQ